MHAPTHAQGAAARSTASCEPPRFLIYWQPAGPRAGAQLFAFTATVSAPSVQHARSSARQAIPRKGRIVGIKQSAGAGLRTLNRGRWVA